MQRGGIVGPGGVRHELWPITGPGQIASLVSAYDSLGTLYIADGHHRSAAASMVHARHPSADSAVFLSVAFADDQVRILPYNRLVRFPTGSGDVLADVGSRFPLRPADGAVTPQQPGSFGLYTADRWYLLDAPEALRRSPDPAQRLDVAVLQRHLLEPVLGIADPRTDPRIGFVGGVRPPAELEEAVDSGHWDAAFTLHATTVADLLAVADAGATMPPKSTWFEPKLLDGLVCHDLGALP